MICQFLFLPILSAQEGESLDFRFQLRLIVEYGTHVHRIGMGVSSATNYAATQFNAELRGYYNFKAYGPPKQGLETVWSLGIAQGFGKSFDSRNPLVDSHYFKTNKRYSIGYTFQKYKDAIETSQSTGTVFFSANNFFLNFENDLFGNTSGRDRFRTGGFSLHYAMDSWIFSVKNIIWTGQTKCQEKVSYTDTDYPSRYGYQDVTNCKYGNHSHGIAAIEVLYQPEDFFRQYYNASIGLDHEKVRHFFQNKIIHDMYFIPNKINPSKNLHYPMLDDKGEPYLFLKDQVLRSPKFYFQVASNGHWLY